MRNVVFFGMVLIAGTLLLSGCAKEPAVEIDAARQALTQAETPDATEYAPQSLAAAREAVRALDEELKVQQGKFVLFRKYEQSKTLAGAAVAAGQKAATDAAAGKARARNEAQDMVAQAKTTLEETRALLASAPRGKGSQADIAALEADLAAAESVIGEAEGLFGQERFLNAKAKAASAKLDIERTRATIQAAIDTYNQARGRR